MCICTDMQIDSRILGENYETLRVGTNFYNYDL